MSLRGSKAFDASRLDSRFGYVFDHATPIGEIVLASPTHHRIDAELRGRAAHAGVRPEVGRSAIAAAASAIAAMRLGRLDAETTANVGTIEGGTAINVIPERCRIVAEVRSLDRERAETVATEMIDHLQEAADAAECDLDVTVQRGFEGYRIRPRAVEVAVAEQALRACGYEPRHIVTGGASDANTLRVAGFPVPVPGGRDRAQPRADRADQRRRARGAVRACARGRRRGGPRAGRRGGDDVSSAAELLGAEVKWEGAVIRAGVERFRHADGTEVTRDKVWHPGAVGIIALDDEHVWLTRQPREVIGAGASLEIPAGKLDVPGEPPLETAKRELAEEIGKRAEHWEELLALLHEPGIQRRARVAVRRDRAVGQRPSSRATRTSGSRSCRGRSRSSTTRSSSARTPSR